MDSDGKIFVTLIVSFTAIVGLIATLIAHHEYNKMTLCMEKEDAFFVNGDCLKESQVEKMFYSID